MRGLFSLCRTGVYEPDMNVMLPEMEPEMEPERATLVCLAEPELRRGCVIGNLLKVCVRKRKRRYYIDSKVVGGLWGM